MPSFRNIEERLSDICQFHFVAYGLIQKNGRILCVATDLDVELADYLG